MGEGTVTPGTLRAAGAARDGGHHASSRGRASAPQFDFGRTTPVRRASPFTVGAGAGTPARMEASSQRPLAVVTGASSGIGYELAKQFATNGFDLIVCAEDSAIVTTATELEGLGASAEAVQADLGQPAGVDQLYGRITAAGRPVAAIALNAGIGMGGAFATDTDLAQELQMVD